ncbi:uncharacterized protein LOC133199371 [Saccostrea echinata]|uniref:uncharacterized protein LOC133199371 n=1 Tax=Saccostrea echinata TaxID=191078 RepID=UPI002A7FABF5|nr:uncharacterized protein LOC133199371 [Saccostrea echinata]
MTARQKNNLLKWTVNEIVVFLLSLEFNKVVIGIVPPGGIEGLWITDVSLNDKVKDDTYLWMRAPVSRMQCALECTADTRCLSHFYKETSATCIAQDEKLDSMTVRNSSGFLAYGFQNPPECGAPFLFDRPANLCFWRSDVKGNRTTAQQVCGAYGGSLVTIDTVAKRSAVLSYPNFANTPTGWQPSFLIDGNDENQEMDFRFKDGSPVPSTFWSGGYPRNNTAENCIHIPTYDPNGLFIHYECHNSNYYFVCQKP